MNDDKQAVRERVWSRMTEAGVVGFPGAKGRIPNFTGAADTAHAWRSSTNGRRRTR